jgi:hypothetical protein
MKDEEVVLLLTCSSFRIEYFRGKVSEDPTDANLLVLTVVVCITHAKVYAAIRNREQPACIFAIRTGQML